MLSARSFSARNSLFISLAVLIALPLVTNAQQSTDQGRLYVMTNKANGNSVLVYGRGPSGTLVQIQEAFTHGLGTGFTGDPLQSQGALALSDDGKLLFAVNPASGDLTSFIVTSAGLQFASKVSSRGALPVSVTEHAGVVYVLNQLGITNIAGYTVDAAGHLTAISGANYVLAGKALAQPAEVSFTPDGASLIITEKGTDLIDVFHVLSNGTASGPTTVKSSGHTPFGFNFGPSNSVVVSEVERRFPMQATVSSYFESGGTLAPVSKAVPNQQSGSCWVTVTGQTAWIVNTGTSNISGYHIALDGSLTLANAVAGSTGANTGPIDITASPDGKLIYVLESNTGRVAVFRVNGASLVLISTKTGLPLSIQGIAIQ